MNNVPHLSGYHITETLYAGSRTLVYRGVRQSDDCPVALKLLRNPFPNFNELVQFRNQYAIAKNIDLKSIVKMLTLIPYGNTYALVMEDYGGISLQELLQREGHLGSTHQTLTAFLQIAIQIAEALDGLYRHRVIHKDLKPANILIHPETKQVKLIDFSIASLLPKETQEIQNANSLEGTIAYISPEQTGRMNRGIDYRSDFYSLGVTFYELLTGQLPFVSDDPMELLHCHLAKQPTPLEQFKIQNSKFKIEIPQIISALVMKLMAKNAEERYQSALGLKHDLEICLHQLATTGNIEAFELGQRDASDRFIIPEKLYGRETEVAALLSAFDRISGIASDNPKSELMLVAGFSGIGKTAVVNEVHKPIVRQRGYFIKGKFDQFNRNIPLSAFVQALRDLMGQLLSESDEQIAQWQVKILTAVGDNGQVLIDVIPELEQIIGSQPLAPELSGSAAQNRFNLLFQKFIAVFTTAEHPLVLFLDDLQWADSASLTLIKLLLMNDSTYLLMLGAYRDNEVSPAHPFILTVEELKKAKAIVNTITLTPLAFTDTNRLIADTLNCSVELAQPLTQLIDRKTQGNPFFTVQFLKALHEDGYIRFDRVGGASQNENRRYWQCDIAQVNALAITDDVVEFMALQVQKLPAETQQLMKLAACVGDRFDLATLAIVSEQSPIYAATALWKGLQEGLILPTSQIYKFFQSAEQSEAEDTANPTYRFLHDRVQQAAYSLIPAAQKTSTHLRIGQLLLAQTPASQQEEKIFTIVNQLNRGIPLISTPPQKIELARLNLKAGRKAKATVAYSAAVEYCQTGILLLGGDRWHDNHSLTLELYNAGVEVAYLNSNYAQMEQWLDEIFQCVPTLLDRIPAYEVKIQAQIAQNQLKDAVATGLGVLDRLGIQLPLAPTADDIGQGFAATATQLEGKTPEDLLALAEMSAAEPLAALKMLAGIWGAAFAIAPPLMPLIVLEMVNLSVRYGNASLSAFAYVLYGVLLCASENFQAGYEFGELSLKLLTRFNTQAFKAKILFLIGTHITIWHDSIEAALPTLQNAYQAGLETGDLEFAALPAAIYSYYSYLAGCHLSDVKQDFVAYTQGVDRIKQTYYLNFLHIWHQAVTNLLEGGESPQRLVGEICNSEELLATFERNNVTTPMAYIYINRLMLNYLFGDYAEAVEVAPLAAEYAQMVPATLLIPIANFYGSLSKLALCDQIAASERSTWLDAVSNQQCQMQKWSECAPMNYRHKYDLVAAERHRVLGQKLEAIELYERAISGAKENGYIQEESLANELAAKFYLDWGKEKIAQTYMVEAYYCYARWGAKAKTHCLEKHYPNLLQPILQQRQLSINLLESIGTFTFGENPSSPVTYSSGHSNITDALDFTSVLKAARAISSSIELDELIGSLTRILLENSGAKKSALILPHEKTWQVRAIASVNYQANSEVDIETVLAPQSLDTCLDVPRNIIQYVKNTQKTVIIDCLKTDIPGLIGDYMLAHQPQSVFCTPIVDRGNLVGVLYLENQLTGGAFTSARLQIINLLSSQAAISLENARLYQQAQQALQDLQQAQLQIVQSEKMSALGNLVAGVAHEINNPVGFISGNITEAIAAVVDLTEYLQLYQEKCPNPGEEVTEKAEEIDLEYLLEDLPKMLNSMQLGCDRIKNISTSLRTFSRADKDYKVPFNLHEGIDSTILILKHRLKANEHRPAIEVMKKYGEFPQIECFPGQLNQVFMNILANAIDMFDEMAQNQSFDSLKANPQQIIIKTEAISNMVKIAIRDNGTGMTEEVKAKMFDHLFTTKGVGKGTGLGLAIARQIIVEKHGGVIDVNSEVGKGTEFVLTLPIC